MSPCFRLYHINHHLGKRRPRNCMGHPLFSQKMGLKPQNFKTSLGTTKANVWWARVSVYTTQITPLENGDQEIWMGQPLFSQKMGSQNFEISLGTTKANVGWARVSVYTTQFTTLENGDQKICMGHPLFFTKNGGDKPKISNILLGTSKAKRLWGRVSMYFR